MKTMKVKTYPYDPAEFLTDDEVVSGYLTDALETCDPMLIAHALGAVARARGGVAHLAAHTGIREELLDQALKEGARPEFETVLMVMRAFGMRLSAEVVA
jgi:probable addiction module antidote protein